MKTPARTGKSKAVEPKKRAPRTTKEGRPQREEILQADLHLLGVATCEQRSKHDEADPQADSLLRQVVKILIARKKRLNASAEKALQAEVVNELAKIYENYRYGPGDTREELRKQIKALLDSWHVPVSDKQLAELTVTKEALLAATGQKEGATKIVRIIFRPRQPDKSNDPDNKKGARVAYDWQKLQTVPPVAYGRRYFSEEIARYVIEALQPEVGSCGLGTETILRKLLDVLDELEDLSTGALRREWRKYNFVVERPPAETTPLAEAGGVSGEADGPLSSDGVQPSSFGTMIIVDR